jgi:DNA-binding response OmpR family regulator
MEKVKVLIIDDEVEFCQTIKLYLETAGKYEVFMAHNGNTGIDLARSNKPDVILLDIMMPGMSGGEVSAELHKDPSMANIPVIYISAIISKDEQAKVYGFTGTTPIIAKPVQAKEVINRIEEVLKNARAERCPKAIYLNGESIDEKNISSR